MIPFEREILACVTEWTEEEREEEMTFPETIHFHGEAERLERRS